MGPMVAKLKALAKQHYDRGGDMMVECWDTPEYEQHIRQCEVEGLDPEQALLEKMELWEDRRLDIESTAF